MSSDSFSFTLNSSHTIKVATQNVRYRIWEIKCLKEGQKAFIKNLDSKGAISISKNANETDPKAIQIMIEATRTTQIEKLLRERDIAFQVIGSDIGPMPGRKQRAPLTHNVITRSLPVKNVLNWNDFHPLYMVNNWMLELEKLYPSTCTVSTIGRSVEGRPMLMLKISNSNASNTGVWLDGCTHAREWITVSVVSYIADYLATNFNKLPQSVTNKDWHFVPVVNPDGYHYSFTMDRMWRKNRARFGNTIVGVDLNRNYGYSWGLSGQDYSSTGDPGHNNYRGPDAFSEPETAAIKDLILYAGTPFKIYVSFHSYSEVIAFPWCHTSDPCPDYVSLLEGGTVMAKAIFDTTGRMYKVGNFKDMMYSAAGTSIDWSYGAAKIPFSYLIELRSKDYKFLLPKDEIIDCCKEALSGVLALAEFSETKKCLNCVVLSKKEKNLS